MRIDSRNSPKLIIDTSTLFSALYNRKGNEALLFDLADRDLCQIIIFDYVIEEIRAVFLKKDLDIGLVYDLLDNINNITISSIGEIITDEISLSRKVIDDPADRPIFIFAKRQIQVYEDSYLISGDKGFFKPTVKNHLDNRILRTREFIDLIIG